MSDQVRSALAACVEGRHLSMDEAKAAMGSVMPPGCRRTKS